MRSATHIRYEILRTFRNGKVLLLTLALPLVVFLAVTPSNRHNHPEGIPFALYFMTGMAAYGAMWAVVLSGAHIAIDRSTGWNRLLRITPLPTRTYFISKVITAYLVALPALGLLYFAGAALGVRLDATQWLEMTGLLLVGVAPFVVLGIILGHALPADALAPAAGGLVVLLALFGGVFGRLFTSGVMFTVVKLLPSYWLVQAGKTASGTGSWPVEGWVVVAAWTVLLTPLAALAYQHDTTRG